MQHRFGQLFISIFILTALFLSCQDDFERLKKTGYSGDWAIPLVDSRFDVTRIFDKAFEAGLLTSNSDGLVKLIYSGELFRLTADEILSFSDFKVDLAVIQGEVGFESSGKLLKHVDWDTGIMAVHIEDALPEDAIVTLTMPKATKNGSVFQKTFLLKHSGFALTIFDTIFDLSGYHFDLTGSDGNQSNQMKMNYEAEKVSNGDSVVLDQFITHFQNLSFNFLDGYLGNLKLGQFNDTMQLKIFDNFKSGSIILENPRFDIAITNGFGLPLSINFSNFSSTGNNGSADLNGNMINNGLNVGSAKDTSNHIVKTEEINSGNSNISNFLSITPKAINFSLDIEANTDNDSTVLNFVSKNSELIGDIDLELPLRGRLDSVVIEDLYALDIQDEASDIDFAVFKLWTENYFPLGIYMQIYFLDDSQNILDSLVLGGEAIFGEAFTDLDGFSIAPKIEETYIAMGERRFARVKSDARMILVKAMLLTDRSSTQSVNIGEDNYFTFKMGVRARLSSEYL